MGGVATLSHLAFSPIYSFAVSLLALSTLLLLSFLKGYVRWSTKKSNPKSASLVCSSKDKRVEPVNELLFDPENYYVQGSAEPSKHVSKESDYDIDDGNNRPVAWSMNAEERVSHTGASQGLSSSRNTERRSSKHWIRSLLFWQRSKKPGRISFGTNQGGLEEGGDGDNSYCPSIGPFFYTPQHRSFKSVALTLPPSPSNHLSLGGEKKLKRGRSGPIYTDGLPIFPSHHSKLSSSSSSSVYYTDHGIREEIWMGSPYQPLNQKHSSDFSLRMPSPLYMVT